MSTKRFFYPPLDAVVAVTVRSNAVRFTARWKGAELHLSIPPDASSDEVLRVLEKMTPGLLKKKPDASRARLLPGARVAIDGGRTLSIVSSGSGGRYMRCRMPDPANIVISLGSDLDAPSPDVQRQLSRIVLRALRVWTVPLGILPGQEIAERLGLDVDKWEVGAGAKTLGRCSVTKPHLLGRCISKITLSSAITLLPEHLRVYIVCHELAHLTHMNHSPQFHALVDRYTGGREAALEAELKKFPWPIIR